MLIGVAQRLDIDRCAVEGGRDRLREEAAIVVGVVPGKAALVMGFLPACGHELDRLERRLAVDDDRLAVGLDLLAAPRPQKGIGEPWSIAEGVPEGLPDRSTFGLELLADLAVGLPSIGKRRYSDLVEPRLA